MGCRADWGAGQAAGQLTEAQVQRVLRANPVK